MDNSYKVFRFEREPKNEVVLKSTYEVEFFFFSYIKIGDDNGIYLHDS